MRFELLEGWLAEQRALWACRTYRLEQFVTQTQTQTQNQPQNQENS